MADIASHAAYVDQTVIKADNSKDGVSEIMRLLRFLNVPLSRPFNLHPR